MLPIILFEIHVTIYNKWSFLIYLFLAQLDQLQQYLSRVEEERSVTSDSPVQAITIAPRGVDLNGLGMSDVLYQNRKPPTAIDFIALICV